MWVKTKYLLEDNFIGKETTLAWSWAKYTTGIKTLYFPVNLFFTQLPLEFEPVSNKFLKLRNLGGIISSSLQENGYVKFSNGIVLQWGKGKTFPVAFANKCLHVSATIDGVYGEGGHANDDIWVNSWSKTGYTTYRNSYKTKFFAIGY